MLLRVSHEHLNKFDNRPNETVHLAIREGRCALFIDHASANHVIAVSGQTGEMVPLHCTAHGKALLPGLSREELRTIFGSTPLSIHTKQTIATPTDLATPCAD